VEGVEEAIPGMGLELTSSSMAPQALAALYILILQ